ncbi:MAG: hypothetical protein IJ673_06345 [Treponema sp.]|nr:hypothetical protein [Treponema sp.]
MKKINKIGIALAAASFAAVSFSGCSWLFDEESGIFSPGYSSVTATETVSKTYSSSNYVFEVSPTTLQLNVSGLSSGKNIYLAKVNTSEKYTIPINAQRAATSATGLASRSAASEIAEIELSSSSEAAEGQFRHFHPEEIKLEDIQKSARSANRAVAIASTAGATTYAVGNTKDIYVDNDVNLSSYAKKTAKLVAKGSKCYVWAVESDFTKMNKSSSDIATKFQEKFDEFYPIETNIFGTESNKLIDSLSSEDTVSAASKKYTMASNSDTGEMINIVLYDIGADYKQSSQCGVLGYFYSKDYLMRTTGSNTVVDYSNQGKYFYIDAPYAASAVKDSSGKEQDTFSTTISTLAHEFQHMINFGVKNIEKDLSPDTAYNEMLSMLCEDMMSSQLGLDDDKSVKAERLPYFNTSYMLSGIREYRDDGAAALSYSTSYGFGSWLCRQYGGAALVKEIMSNDYVDNDSLVNAVNTLNGKSYTFDDLFKQFLVACVDKNKTTGYTHNKNAAQTVTYSGESDTYSYPMTAIDLWASAYGYPTSTNKFLIENQENCAYDKSVSSWTGPFILSNAYGVSLRPYYGISLHQIGTTSGSDLSLTFSSSGADCVTMYVIIL